MTPLLDPCPSSSLSSPGVLTLCGSLVSQHGSPSGGGQSPDSGLAVASSEEATCSSRTHWASPGGSNRGPGGVTGFCLGSSEVPRAFSAVFLSVVLQKGGPAAPPALRTAASDAMKGRPRGPAGSPGGEGGPWAWFLQTHKQSCGRQEVPRGLGFESQFCF